MDTEYGDVGECDDCDGEAVWIYNPPDDLDEWRVLCADCCDLMDALWEP
jgi:hypothetical protein